ncbi:hypothetical protein BD414DRAFT_472987 [Trametes punicea]|nr:hypothetical protein BD414DRAFT_472987 [Trametes punicea]
MWAPSSDTLLDSVYALNIGAFAGSFRGCGVDPSAASVPPRCRSLASSSSAGCWKGNLNDPRSPVATSYSLCQMDSLVYRSSSDASPLYSHEMARHNARVTRDGHDRLAQTVLQSQGRGGRALPLIVEYKSPEKVAGEVLTRGGREPRFVLVIAEMERRLPCSSQEGICMAREGTED